jgi:RimJ/RimL family protein N-acetyltransferase
MEPLTKASAAREADRIIQGHGGDHLAFMIEADGKVVGNCWLGHLSDVSATLGIVIAPEWRNRGIGTAAIHSLLKRAGPRQIDLWVLEGNERAKALYKRFGFRETSRNAGRIYMSRAPTV